MGNEVREVLLMREVIEQMNKVIFPLRKLDKTEKDSKINSLYRNLVIGYDELVMIYNARTSNVLESLAN